MTHDEAYQSMIEGCKETASQNKQSADSVSAIVLKLVAMIERLNEDLGFAYEEIDTLHDRIKEIVQSN